jgi:hypothetical protein
MNISTMKPATSYTDLADRYIQTVFIPKLLSRYDRVTTDISGDVLWLKGGTLKTGGKFDMFYATPNIEEQQLIIQFEDGGGVIEFQKHKYKLDEWTMDVESDILHYINKLQKILDRVSVMKRKLTKSS